MLWYTRTPKQLAHDVNDSNEEGKVALLHGTCVGEVDRLTTEDAFGTQGLVDSLHMTCMAQSAKAT